MTTTSLPDPTDPVFLERLRSAVELLELLDAQTELLGGLPAEDHARLRRAIAQLYNPDAAARRRNQKAMLRAKTAERRKQDDALLHETGIRILRTKPVFTTPNYEAPPVDGFRDTPSESAEERHCYVCKQKFSSIHHFYDQMCPECAEFNYAKRTELANLHGRVALLTGGRVKIGYQAGLKLLRSGARLIVTTRFPRDSASRYAKEHDFGAWSNRLEIFGLDMRHAPSVETFCRQILTSYPRLDFIINNACQTVRRPPEFYAHMMAAETSALRDAPGDVRRLLGSGGGTEVVHGAVLPNAAELSQIPLLAEERERRAHLFPEGSFDQDLQQVDLRGRNSWRLLMAEVLRWSYWKCIWSMRSLPSLSMRD